jgi:alkanesulfonate monooxygenase SsuD/methylene tetrahydromethanopterin reductase-like flavin-dependent oxidoreductase (luciferase family)
VSGVDSQGKGVPSGVVYSVQIAPTHGEPFTVDNAKPNQLRPADIVKLVAAKVGHTGIAQRIGDNWFFNVWEYPDIAECQAP